MLSKSDPWDELLHAIGQGWPHYKNIAKPLVRYKPKNNKRIYLYLILSKLILQRKGAQHEHI